MFSSYLDFEITIDRFDDSSYLLSAHGPGGDARSSLVLPSRDPRYQALSTRLLHLDTDELVLQELGQMLFQAIFQGPVREVYARSQGVLQAGQGLRLVLNMAPTAPELSALPWEYLADPDQGPLALLDTSIVRYLPQQQVIPKLALDLPFKVLLTGAETSGSDVAPELQAIQDALAGLGSFVQITIEPHLTVGKLQRLLREESFHIWHFIGHGDLDEAGTTGQLAFEDATGERQYITAPQLSILLNRTSIRVVVLSACRSAHLAIEPYRSLALALVRAHIPAVVAMQFSAAQDANRAFAGEFYQALAEGFSIDACVTEGRKAVMNVAGLNRPDWGIPVVYTRAADGMIFDLPPLPKPACPYPGMVPFHAGDARFFYGREAEITAMLQHLRYQRLLFVIGPSGSGKSSLVRAGLLPRLQASRLFPDRFWLIHEMRPSHQPLMVLEQAAAGVSAQVSTAIKNLLKAHPPAERLLLIVDQFEEVFAQANRDEQQRFVSTLQELRRSEDCALIIAMRADFFPDLMTSDLWPIDASQRLEVSPLRGTALRQAIEQPALDLGVRLEPGLIERLMSDAADEPGVLPFLQETLVLLWDRMVHRLLQLRTYERLGQEGQSGLAAALAVKANATIATLSSAHQAVARRIFLRLIQFGEGRADTRRQQFVNALHSAGEDAALFETTLAHLANNRLLTLTGDEEDADRKADIAHEALISGWPKLRQWAAERREAEQTRRRLEVNAAEWVRLGRGRGGLLDEAELPEALRWLDSPDATDLGYDAALPALVEASRAAIEAEEQEKDAARRRELEHARALAKAQSRSIRNLWTLVVLLGLLTLAGGIALGRPLWLRQRAIWLSPVTAIAVPGGMATIGSDEANAAITSRPAHVVKLPSFEIDTHEVTNQQYCLCRSSGGCGNDPIYDAQRVCDAAIADDPVTNVTLMQASEYCSWIGRRLPTEMEWEWAARGPAQRRYPTSDEQKPAPDQVNLRDPAAPSSAHKAWPVGSASKDRTPDNGVMDMAGNVQEWTVSLYLPYTHPQADRIYWPARVADAPGLAQGIVVVRGGSWYTEPEGADATRRYPLLANEAYKSDLGFRCLSGVSLEELAKAIAR